MPKSTSILVVDDEPALVDGLAVFLSDEGYEVRIARDGAEALERQALVPSDVIVSDVMMPRLDGWHFVASLRARGDTTPVVLMSAGGRHRADVPGVETMRKPFDLDALLHVIDRLIQRS